MSLKHTRHYPTLLFANLNYLLHLVGIIIRQPKMLKLAQPMRLIHSSKRILQRRLPIRHMEEHCLYARYIQVCKRRIDTLGNFGRFESSCSEPFDFGVHDEARRRIRGAKTLLGGIVVASGVEFSVAAGVEGVKEFVDFGGLVEVDEALACGCVADLFGVG